MIRTIDYKITNIEKISYKFTQIKLRKCADVEDGWVTVLGVFIFESIDKSFNSKKKILYTDLI